MATKERLGLALARSLKVNGAVMTPCVGGSATITGTGTVTATGLSTITGVFATLGADASLAAFVVTATWSGLTITLSVWKPTGSANPTPIAATAAIAVNWLAIGS